MTSSDPPNYEQSRQKLGTFLENKVLLKSKLSNILTVKKKESERFGWFLMPNTNFANFEEVAHNLGRSDNDMI